VSTTISIPGSGNVDVNVFGRGTVIAGNGNDSITIGGPGKIIRRQRQRYADAGRGRRHLRARRLPVMTTINIGSGNATIYSQGYATITGAFGTATIAGGGGFEINQTGSAPTTSSGSTGQSHSTVSGSSGTGHESVISGSGHVVGDHHPRQGGMERNLFATFANQIGGAHIKSFVSGIPVLHLEATRSPI